MLPYCQISRNESTDRDQAMNLEYYFHIYIILLVVTNVILWLRFFSVFRQRGFNSIVLYRIYVFDVLIDNPLTFVALY